MSTMTNIVTMLYHSHVFTYLITCTVLHDAYNAMPLLLMYST